MTTTLQSGIAVSHYDVIGPIGAGGMGEVYKARDRTLERAVALKILPPALVRNEERVRRFIQEAKSASALNHPNIVTIYEIGQSEIGGQSATSGDRPIWYIAMELIEGSTLKQKIYEERSDLRSLLAWLAQCAEGLARAHSVGLVHRDLKPENIMITRDGFAKVLDFGLAKLTVQRSEDSADSTVARDDTREGTLLGTIAYMSPEQVQGRIVDHRSDIFSFGSILYEAATRRRPFQADSDVDVMHQILHDKPQPIDEIDPAVPAELRRMIRRCMAKDPERRYHSMRDLALELSDIVEEFEELSASSSSRSSASTPQPVAIGPVSHRRLWITASVAVVVAVAALAFGLWQWRLARVEKPKVAYASMKIEKVTSTGEARSCAISPDGKYLAHVIREDGRQALMVRQIATGSDVRVMPPQNSLISVAAFSPDGNYIYYRQSDQPAGVGYFSLYQVPALGGTPQKVLFDVDTPISFSPDGKQFAFGRALMSSGTSSVVVANADGAGLRVLSTIKRIGIAAAPAWSPNGKRIVAQREIMPNGALTLVALDPVSSRQEPIGTSGWTRISAVCWLPDGSGLVVAGLRSGESRQQIWFHPYPSGDPLRITNDLNDYVGASLSADGKILATIQAEYRGELFLSSPDDPDGGRTLREGIGNSRVITTATNRAGAIVYSFGSENGTDIALLPQPEAEPRVLTRDGRSGDPAISNDGKIIVYTSRREATPHVWAMSADGSGARQLTRGEGEGSPVCRDGKTVYYRITGGPQRRSIWRIGIDGGSPVKVVDSAAEFALSMDGSRMFYASIVPIGGRDEIRATVATTADFKPIASWQPITGSAAWTPDGNEIGLVVTNDGVSNVFLQPLSNAPARQLTHFKKGRIAAIDWMPSGELLIQRRYSRSDAVLIRDFR